MAARKGYVLVPRWAVKALVEPATIQDQGRALRALEAALTTDPDAEER
jgi:hypothetical protein